MQTDFRPPACGKTMMSEHLAAKFSLVCLDWMDMIRGAARWADQINASHCQQYLKDMTPIPKEVVKEILKVFKLAKLIYLIL